MKEYLKIGFLVAFLSIIFINFKETKKEYAITRRFSKIKNEDQLEYMTHIESLKSKYSRPPMVTFTNKAHKNFVKSFICNLMSLAGSFLTSRLVVIVSDPETFKDIKNFNSDASLILKPFGSHSQNLDYGTTSYAEYIEYRYQKERKKVCNRNHMSGRAL